MARVSHKLSNAFEGALAGGGDPATSPLYVFGPFLKLIVVAGVAQVTYGASIWMVIFTIAAVSAMYRLVMIWVIDGSGGSGLSEEEFGGWAVKVNAAITFIEYTLTFLVSMAAMVTFIADRIPQLNQKILWIEYRTFLAIALSILTGWLVNRGPKMAARTFGPATLGVLVLLWAMVISTVVQRGIQLPPFNLQAFSPEYLGFTLNGFVRILAVMTGIEVFANLVAAYDGEPAQKSSKAFNSLLIVMGTTAVTMIIVGPAIFELSDATNTNVSVFTQTMDILLPVPLPYLGTIVGIAVLMSASAASAQGLQNLFLGMNERNYIPHLLGQRNRFGVADKPVWIEVAIVVICFLLFGTHEETYLALYAAGVFILLSMTGWAVAKRLLKEFRKKFSVGTIVLIIGTVLAATMTTGSTAIIFFERFFEGAWTYFLFIPLLFWAFSYFRTHLGEPTREMDYLGLLDAARLAGFGFGQYETPTVDANGVADKVLEVTWQPDPIERSTWREKHTNINKIVVLLDGSTYAGQAIPMAKSICHATGAEFLILSSIKDYTQQLVEQYPTTYAQRTKYLDNLLKDLKEEDFHPSYQIRSGFIADATSAYILENEIDLVITSTRGKSGVKHWVTGGVSRKLIQKITQPIVLVQDSKANNGEYPNIKKILVALDGSIASESTLPYARTLAKSFNSEIILLSVPAVPEMENYRAPDEFVRSLRNRAIKNMRKFLNAVARSLREDGIHVKTMVTGHLPARTIVSVAKREKADLIMLTTRGRGGLKLLFLGSVAERVVQSSSKPVFLIPVEED